MISIIEAKISQANAPVWQRTSSLRFTLADETDDYFVRNKPPFLLTHPTKPDQRTTLWKELRELLAFEIANGGDGWIVKGLEVETMGFIFVEKTPPPPRRFRLVLS